MGNAGCGTIVGCASEYSAGVGGCLIRVFSPYTYFRMTRAEDGRSRPIVYRAQRLLDAVLVRYTILHTMLDQTPARTLMLLPYYTTS
jgi:hypothetical protein